MDSKVFIDVREPEEFARSHVEGAINIPPSELMSGAKALIDVPKKTKLVIYCITGSRSNASINILKSLGFENIENGINKQQVEAKYFNN